MFIFTNLGLVLLMHHVFSQKHDRLTEERMNHIETKLATHTNEINTLLWTFETKIIRQVEKVSNFFKI